MLGVVSPFFADLADWVVAILRSYIRPASGKGVEIIPRGLLVTLSRCGYHVDGETFDLQELERRLLTINRAVPVIIELMQDRYLRRPLSKRAIPFGRALTIAKLDADEHAPFLREGTHILLADTASGAEMDYYIVHKVILDPIIEVLARIEQNTVSIHVQCDEGVKILNRRSINYIIPISRSVLIKNRLLFSAAMAILIILFSTFTHLYVRGATASAELGRLIELKKAQSLVVRTGIEKRQQELRLLHTARIAKLEAVPITAIWEDLSQLIPNNTWLTDLSIRDYQITITGFSRSAADLITILGASLILVEPTFTAPVMRVPGQEGERFSIQLKIRKK